jgi:hypothetical protein
MVGLVVVIVVIVVIVDVVDSLIGKIYASILFILTNNII